MSDFNKKELEFLKHATREQYKNNPPIKGSTYVNICADMIRKLQNMIDDLDNSNTDRYIDDE